MQMHTRGNRLSLLVPRYLISASERGLNIVTWQYLPYIKPWNIYHVLNAHTIKKTRYQPDQPTRVRIHSHAVQSRPSDHHLHARADLHGRQRRRSLPARRLRLRLGFATVSMRYIRRLQDRRSQPMPPRARGRSPVRHAVPFARRGVSGAMDHRVQRAWRQADGWRGARESYLFVLQPHV